MDDSIQALLVDLKIVSMAEPGGKLFMNDGMLALEPVSMWQPLLRYLSNSNRCVIGKRIKQRIVELENVLRENQIKDEWVVQEIIKLINPTIEGIRNLQNTYASDSQIQATFGLLIARLENIDALYLHTYLANIKE